MVPYPAHFMLCCVPSYVHRDVVGMPTIHTIVCCNYVIQNFQSKYNEYTQHSPLSY